MTMNDGHANTWMYQGRYYETHVAAPADFTGSFVRDGYTVHGRPTFDQLLADVVIGGGPWDAVVCYGPFGENEWPAVKEHAGNAVLCLDYAGGPLCGLNGEPPAMAPLFDHVFTAHETQAAFLRGLGVSASKARGVPTNHYRPIPGVPKLYRIVCAGQFSPGKRPQLVSEMLERQAPSEPSLFIGGFENPAIVDMVLAGGIPLNRDVPHRNNVRIGQRAPYEVMPLIYNSARVCVMGSQEEAGPWVPLEAMACGVPAVVMSDCAWGVAEAFKEMEGYGVLVAPPEPNAMHEAVEWLLANYAQQSLLARAAILTRYEWFKDHYDVVDRKLKELIGLKAAGQSGMVA
jgi:glycosyltransferase involved in cell wall biosynthesis